MYTLHTTTVSHCQSKKKQRLKGYCLSKRTCWTLLMSPTAIAHTGAVPKTMHTSQLPLPTRNFPLRKHRHKRQTLKGLKSFSSLNLSLYCPEVAKVIPFQGSKEQRFVPFFENKHVWMTATFDQKDFVCVGNYT